MCGICGIVDTKGNSVEPELLARLNRRLFHRGPDEGGEWTSGSVGLAMRRLAIIDLSSGQQPIFNEDRTVAIVFNGEIYNYHELRDELEKLGHRFATHSDTETIVHLYEQYGTDCFSRLNGMFAVSIWDSRRNQLVLARDRVGKKPLYYSAIGDRLVFSSEITSLIEHPDISRSIDRLALDEFFTLGYVPAPRTIYEQVKQLEPAHFLLWKSGSIQVGRYWRLQPRPFTPQTEDEVAAQLLDLLRDAVRIRLYSDVPFGALLSGGIDSGLVVGLMSQIMKQPVKTFTVGFSDKTSDESSYAGEVAKYFGTEHHNIVAKPHDVLELIDKLTTHFGEPFADSSAIPTYLVSEMARQHVTMCLSGDGGDEVFGGYNSYRYHATAARYRKIPSSFRRAARVAASIADYRPGGIGRRVRRFVTEAELPVDRAWRNSRSIFTDGELAELYTADALKQVEKGQRGSQILGSFDYFRDAGSDADILNFVDYETYLPGDILVKVDRMSMANSLEMRAPLLDYRIAEFAAGLPREWKWNGTEGKRILRKAAKAVLPKSSFSRPKHGFSAPIGGWFRRELEPFMRQLISRSRAGDVIRLDFCVHLLDRHLGGEGGLIERKLWSIMVFLLWHERFAQA